MFSHIYHKRKTLSSPKFYDDSNSIWLQRLTLLFCDIASYLVVPL